MAALRSVTEDVFSIVRRRHVALAGPQNLKFYPLPSLKCNLTSQLSEPVARVCHWHFIVHGPLQRKLDRFSHDDENPVTPLLIRVIRLNRHRHK